MSDVRDSPEITRGSKRSYDSNDSEERHVKQLATSANIFKFDNLLSEYHTIDDERPHFCKLCEQDLTNSKLKELYILECSHIICDVCGLKCFEKAAQIGDYMQCGESDDGCTKLSSYYDVIESKISSVPKRYLPEWMHTRLVSYLEKDNGANRAQNLHLLSHSKHLPYDADVFRCKTRVPKPTKDIFSPNPNIAKESLYETRKNGLTLQVHTLDDEMSAGVVTFKRDVFQYIPTKDHLKFLIEIQATLCIQGTLCQARHLFSIEEELHLRKNHSVDGQIFDIDCMQNKQFHMTQIKFLLQHFRQHSDISDIAEMTAIAKASAVKNAKSCFICLSQNCEMIPTPCCHIPVCSVAIRCEGLLNNQPPISRRSGQARPIYRTCCMVCGNIPAADELTNLYSNQEDILRYRGLEYNKRLYYHHYSHFYHHGREHTANSPHDLVALMSEPPGLYISIDITNSPNIVWPK